MCGLAVHGSNEFRFEAVTRMRGQHVRAGGQRDLGKSGADHIERRPGLQDVRFDPLRGQHNRIEMQRYGIADASSPVVIASMSDDERFCPHRASAREAPAARCKPFSGAPDLEIVKKGCDREHLAVDLQVAASSDHASPGERPQTM